MFWKNDWQTYGYDGDYRQKLKLSTSSVWDVKIKKTITRPVGTYYDELLLNAQAIAERFPGKHDLMLSGGVDSELILYSHLKSKIPINVVVGKYKDGLNEADFYQAMETCRIYDVKPTIIDLDVKKYFESGEAHDIWTKNYARAPGMLPPMKIIEKLDNMPIMGDGMNIDSFMVDEPRGPWKLGVSERWFVWTVHCAAIGRPIIAKFFDYSPELTMAILNLNLHKLKNQKPIRAHPRAKKMEKLKYIVNNEHFGTRIRPCLSGYEKCNTINETVPQFMLDFRDEPQHQDMDSNPCHSKFWPVDELKKLL